MVAAVVAVLLGPMAAAPAIAGPVVGQWHTAAGVAGTSYFIGQHRNADGTTAYCTDFERFSPDRASGYTDGGTGPFTRSDGTVVSTEENATLAYVLGRWGATDDDEEAAAVQLAVWSITAVGLAWDSPAMIDLMRTQALPSELGTRARSMVEQARAEAGPYSIATSIAAGGSEDGVEASVVSADGAPRAGMQVSAVVLGAVFPDGTTTTTWTSSAGPQELVIQRTGYQAPHIRFTAPSVPAPHATWLTPAERDVQRLVIAPVSVAATAAVDLPELPHFAPRVVTATSAARTGPGTQVSDLLEVSATDPGTWLVDPVTGDDVTVDVVSTLWGPLPAPPVESASVPGGTPSLGSVTTTIAGPGRYETGALTVPTAGYYVWTESIDASSARPVEAAPFVDRWSGRFGVAPETTLVPWEPILTTELTQSTVAPGATVRDTVTAEGFSPVEDDDLVRLTLYGPLDGRPSEALDIPPGAPVHSELHVPARIGTTISGDFAVLEKPGCYTVVASFAGSSVENAFTSAFGIANETVCVEPPQVLPEPVPTAEPVPVAEAEAGGTPAAAGPISGGSPTSSATDSIAEPTAVTPPAAAKGELAQTGVSAGLMVGLALIAMGTGVGVRILSRRSAAG